MSTSSGNSDSVIPSPPIITLLSDFGLSDPYVASMKGVILSICGKAVLIDIGHSVSKFKTSQGAYLLAATVPYFPVGTIHLCVVDPGVGTERRALLVRTRRSYLIGPDNGVLMLAARKEGIEKVIELRNPSYMLEKVFSTFHGRDIFAAIAAHLANGVKTDEFGPEIADYHQPTSSKPSTYNGTLFGEIIHVDDFGNIVTNISPGDLSKLDIKLGSKIKIAISRTTRIIRFCRTYGEVKDGEHLALIGSTDFLEIAINKGNAASLYKAEEGIEVSVSTA